MLNWTELRMIWNELEITAETGLTGAMILVDEVDASSAVQTLAVTIVQISFTIETRKSFDAVTRVVARSVFTRLRIPAQVGSTFVHI